MPRLLPAICLGLSLAACGAPQASPTAEVSPSAKLDLSGILLVDVDEQTQPHLPTEALKVAFSRAQELADANGRDLGYPWFDPATGDLVFSTVTPRGLDLIESASFAFPYRIRHEAHGAAELARIQSDLMNLRSQGVPGAELIYGTGPDYRDNRVVIVVGAMCRALVDALGARFPVDAIAVQVDPRWTPSGARPSCSPG